MSKELYENCPCGSGKKIKFCCPRELQTDFLKALDLLNSHQRAAAIERADRALAKVPGQSCLLMVKITALMQMHELEAARQVWQRLNESAPQNPVTKVFKLLLGIDANTPQDMIDRMQDSLEQVQQFPIPYLVLSGLELTIVSLAEMGQLFSFIQHAHHYDKLMLADPQARILGALKQACLDPSFPLIFKQPWLDRLMSVYPEPFKKADARQDVGLFRWRRIRDRFIQWRAQGQFEPGATAYLALMHVLLLQNEEGAALLRDFAQRPNVPLELAVEAKLLAHVLDPAGDPGALAQLRLEYTVPDMDRLMERLLSDKRAQDLKVDLQSMAAEDEPPPRAAFQLMDRPPQEATGNISDTPRFLATAVLYGRQTDREARMELILKADPQGKNQQSIEDILSDAVAKPPKSDEVALVSPLDDIGPRVKTPEFTNYEEVLDFNQRYLDYTLNEYWPQQPHPLLGGKTPTEAKDDPSLKTGLMGALIHLETSHPTDIWLGDYRSYWERFGIDYQLNAWDPRKAQILWLTRVNPEQLEDAVLWSAAVFAAAMSVRRACEQLGAAVLARPTLRDRDELGELLRVLSETPLPVEKRLAFIEAAIEWCERKNISSGLFRVRQFVCQVHARQSEEASQTLNVLTTQYRNEPETMELLYETLKSMGLLRPDGTLTSDDVEAEGLAETQAEPAAAGSLLWTPDQPAAAPSAEKPSKLWLPGQ